MGRCRLCELLFAVLIMPRHLHASRLLSKFLSAVLKVMGQLMVPQALPSSISTRFENTATEYCITNYAQVPGSEVQSPLTYQQSR
jgi:hypothetical protein